MDSGDLRQRGGAFPLVEREPQSAPHPDIVERLLLMVRGDQVRAVPVAFLHRDLVAQLLFQLVARRGRQAAKLHLGPVGADRVDPGRLLRRVERDKAVEVRLSLTVIIRVAIALDRLADFVAGEFERAGAHHILFVPVRVLRQRLLLVDERKRIGEGGEERRGGEFETENHGLRIRRVDLVDHREVFLPGAGDALRRVHDIFPVRRDIGCRQRRTVVEFDVLADLEGVSLAVIGRLRHLGAQIAHEVGRRRRVRRVDPDQNAVKRRDGMQGREGRLAMPIEGRRRIGRDHIGEGAAALRRIRGPSRRRQACRRNSNSRGCKYLPHRRSRC